MKFILSLTLALFTFASFAADAPAPKKEQKMMLAKKKDHSKDNAPAKKVEKKKK